MSGSGAGARQLVFLSHATDRSGPPVYLLHLLRWLADHTDRRLDVLSLCGGDLAPEVAEVAGLQVVHEPNPVRLPRGSRHATRARDLLRASRVKGVDRDALVHVNTAWSVRALRYLPWHRGPVVAHVHELEVGLDYHLPSADRALLFSRTDHWVAASQAVADNLTHRWGVAPEEIHVHHEMIDTAAPARVDPAQVRSLRHGIGLGPGATLVGTTAVLNWRKAPDLFVELAARVVRRHPDIDPHFAWVGVDDRSPEVAALRRDARRAGIADRLHLVAVSARPEAWMRAFDVFVLPAREDAFPLAALEAAAAGRPVVCFAAGGMPEFVRTDAGAVVDFPDVAAMSREVAELSVDPARRREAGRAAQRRVVRDHDVAVAAPRLWSDLDRWSSER